MHVYRGRLELVYSNVSPNHPHVCRGCKAARLQEALRLKRVTVQRVRDRPTY